MDLGSHVGGYGHGNYGLRFSTYDVENQYDFETALREYRGKKNLLLEKNVYSFYNEAIQLVTETIIQYLTDFYKKFSKEERDVWVSLSVKLDMDKQKIISIDCHFYKEEIKVVGKDETIRMGRKITEKVNLIDNSEIKIDFALNNYGFSFGEDYTTERKAKKSHWIFNKEFEKLFFKIIGYDE